MSNRFLAVRDGTLSIVIGDYVIGWGGFICFPLWFLLGGLAVLLNSGYVFAVMLVYLPFYLSLNFVDRARRKAGKRPISISRLDERFGETDSVT